MIVRKANIDTDGVWILHIRNNEQVFRYFNNNSKVELDTHITWLAKYLKNDQNLFLVWEEDWVIACYARKDSLWNNKFEISIAVDPLFQGRWFAKRLIEEMISLLKKWELLIAEIHKWNPSSQKLFERVWFTKYNEDPEKIYMHYSGE